MEVNKNNNDIFKIPNFFTLLNILCGIFSIYLAIEKNFNIAGILILLAMLFDFLDGFFARILKQQSDFGKQLDSFADMITFGLSPTIIVYIFNYENMNLFLMISLIIYVLSIIFRLSKYNLDCEKQKYYFLGLPSTFSGGFIAFLILCFPVLFNLQYSYLLFLFLALLSVSNIPYKKLRFHNIYQIIFIAFLIFLYFILKKYSFLFIFIFYIMSGFINIIFDFLKKRNDWIHIKMFNLKRFINK
jgi:CDP-diacylglycerol--serine O-phosphatidyltransferase